MADIQFFADTAETIDTLLGRDPGIIVTFVDVDHEIAAAVI